ncbi:hypothetical protein R1sor_013071 [Riccia sorocarpa]|uniref:Lipoprotein n=1 Tax=Riccia sorocarpa TaxID=122646 RepID=A0ABD3H5G3_9MARC
MARSALYVIIPIICAAIAGCAATRDFADERAILEQPARVESVDPPSPFVFVHMNFTSENEDPILDASCLGFVDSWVFFRGSFSIVSGNNWTAEVVPFTRFYCQFSIQQSGWYMEANLWRSTPDEVRPPSNVFYLIDDVGVFRVVLGEKKLVANWGDVIHSFA